MKYFTIQILVLLFFFSSCASQDRKIIKATETETINLVFKNYTEAIQAGQGQEAIKYISQKTLDYYDSLIYHTLFSDEIELNKINILTRTAILRMRHTQSVSFWDTMTSKKLLEQMWSRTAALSPMQQISLTDCKIDNLRATCILQLNGQPTEMNSIFNKENGEWKIDITSINSNGVEEMKNDIKRRNISETEYIILTLRELENKEVSKAVLYTPLKRK